MIWLSSNRIYHIEPDVFDFFIGKLRYLSLDSNDCISSYASNNTEEVKNLIINATKVCVNSKIIMTKLLSKIDKLEIKFEKFEKKIESKEAGRGQEEKNDRIVLTLIMIILVSIVTIILILYCKTTAKKSQGSSKLSMIFENPKFEAF